MTVTHTRLQGPIALGFLRKGDKMRRPLASFLVALNVSFVLTTVGPNALAREDSTFATMDFPGGTFTVVLDISPTGEIVGSYNDANGTLGYLRSSSGHFMTIDIPAANFTRAAALVAAVTSWERTGFLRIRCWQGRAEFKTTNFRARVFVGYRLIGPR